MAVLELALFLLFASASAHGIDNKDACNMQVSKLTGVRGRAYRRLNKVSTPEECCAMCMRDSECAAWVLESQSKGLE